MLDSSELGTVVKASQGQDKSDDDIVSEDMLFAFYLAELTYHNAR